MKESCDVGQVVYNVPEQVFPHRCQKLGFE